MKSVNDAGGTPSTASAPDAARRKADEAGPPNASAGHRPLGSDRPSRRADGYGKAS